MSTPQDNSAENQDQSSFSLNYNRITRGFRGTIKVESPFEPGVYVTRGYTTSPVYESEAGKQYVRIGVQSGSPMEQARDARINPANTVNPHPGIGIRRVNEGVYYPASEEEEEKVRTALAEGRSLPMGKGYVLMPFTNPDTGLKEPYAVELTTWVPEPEKEAFLKREPVRWLGGSARIFDRETFLANSRKYGDLREHISGEELEAAHLPDDNQSFSGGPAHEPDGLAGPDPRGAAEPGSPQIQNPGDEPDGTAARQGAGRRARKRAEPDAPKPEESL